MSNVGGIGMHHDEHETAHDWLRSAIGVLRGGNMPGANEVDVTDLHRQVQDSLTVSVQLFEETESQTWIYAGLVKVLKRYVGGSIEFEPDDEE